MTARGQLKSGMRLVTAIPLVALVAAAVLGVAVWGLRWERARLLEDFAQAQQRVAAQIASDLDQELDELNSTAEVIATLVQRARSRGPIDEDSEHAFIRSGFEALATAVRHYRSISLMRGDVTLVRAVDPRERPDMASGFQEWSVAVASRLGGPVRSLLDGPREGPDGRQFFIYARALEGDERVVLVSKARYLLQPVLHTRSSTAHYFLIDPSRSIWVGCAQFDSCRAFTTSDWPAIPGLAAIVDLTSGPEGRRWTSEEIPRALGLPSRPAALAWTTIERDGRRWIAGVVGSAQPIEAREKALFWWLVGTSAALAGALGTVAAFIITHQRRSATLRERLRHAQEVAHLRERTEKLIENLPVGLVGVTGEGTVTLTNRFLSDRSVPLPIGADLADTLGEGDAAAAAPIRHALDEALRTGRPRFIRGDETQLLASHPGHFDLRIIPLEQPADDVRALVLLEDLSELKTLEKHLVRAEKLVTVGVLTAGLAHEIGTPLGIIRGRAEVLLGKVKDPAVARDLDSIVRQIDQIGSTIRQVLDFARTQPVELRPVAPEEAVRGAVDLLDWRLRGKGLTVNIQAPPGLASVAADPDQLQQVLVNLLMNACDACAQNGTITVRLRPSDPPGSVLIEVEDDGCGIATEDLNAVFDPFFTTKKRGEGTGLGLPVAASIVRNHHGEISLTSNKGVGTTITVAWPVAASPRHP